MKIRKKFLRFLSVVLVKLRKIVRYMRKFHPFEYLKAMNYLNNINSIKEIEIPDNESVNINFLGKSTNQFLKTANFDKISEMKNSLNFADIASEGIKKNNINFYGHFKNEMIIFKNNTNKLAYISFKPGKDPDCDFRYLKKMVTSAKILKSNFIIVYIKNRENNKLWKKYRYINKILGRLGADYIIYSDKDGQVKNHLIKIYRADKPTYVTKSIDSFSRKTEISSIIHVNVNLNNIRELSEYYFLVRVSQGSVRYLNMKSNKNKNISAIYSKGYKKLNEKSKVILLKDVFGVLGLDCPDKYKYLLNTTVGKICGKWSEVNKNDVLFLLEPYKYKNDKTTATDQDRLRQVTKALSKGVLFIFSYMPLDKNIPHVVCDNAREAHIKMCNYLYLKQNIKTIAVTGSVGKTTTKDMLACVFSEKYNVLKSPKNGNLQIPIGINIQNIDPTKEFYIQEIGGGRPGGASRHSRMINPDMAVVTNIGSAHLGNFENQKDLMMHKLGIIEGLKPDGVFFQNMDDDLLKTANITTRKVIKYSVDNKNADYYASDIVFGDNEMQFNINIKATKKKYSAKLNVLGMHNVLNAVVCFAMGDHYGLTPEEIINGLEKFRTSGIRQNTLKIANQDFVVDCFNASLDSVVASIKTFEKYEVKNNGKKIVVLGDVTGMGDSEEEIHHSIADELVKHTFDNIVLYGNSIKIVSDDLNKYNIKHDYVKSPDIKKLNMILKSLIKPNDVVLLKGSSKLSLEYQIDLLYGTNLACFKYIEESEYQSVPARHYKYRIFDDFSILYKFKGKYRNIILQNYIFNKKVRGIFNNCFKNNKRIVNVYLNKNCVHIGDGAFKSCIHLKNVKFRNIQYIGKNAFFGCKSLKKVKLNDGVLHISSMAFANCTQLEEIYIPNSVRQIDENVFIHSKNVVIICEKDSIAHKYAIENEMSYKCV